MDLQKGSVVLSRAGRDKGCVLFVTGLAAGEYVYLANGKMRPLSAPKLKKKLHLHLLCACDEELCVQFEQGCLTDSHLRERLSDYQAKL